MAQMWSTQLSVMHSFSVKILTILDIEKKIYGIVTECKEHIMRMGHPNPNDVSQLVGKKKINPDFGIIYYLSSG